jgi:hypothetical protein
LLIMPMPHRTFAQVAKRRLVGKKAQERIREVRALLDELPDYRNGPYADLRKTCWTRSRTPGSDRARFIATRSPCAARVLRRSPWSGRQRRQVIVAAGAVRDSDQDRRLPVHNAAPGAGPDATPGVLVQLVEIPGLIRGASDDRGGGRALLGVLRSADAIVFCLRIGDDAAELETVRAELAAADIDKPAFVAATRADEAAEGDIERLASAIPGLDVLPVSVLDEASIDALRERLWQLTGLIRIYLRSGGSTDEEPLALAPGATVADVADFSSP